MQTVLVSLAAVACPVAMGVMMWFMGRGMRSDKKHSVPPSLEALREEHQRMGREIERLQGGETVTKSRS